MKSGSGSGSDRRVGAVDRAVRKVAERSDWVYSGVKPRIRAERRRLVGRGRVSSNDEDEVEESEARDLAEGDDSTEGAGEGTRWVSDDPSELVEDGMVEFRL